MRKEEAMQTQKRQGMQPHLTASCVPSPTIHQVLSGVHSHLRAVSPSPTTHQVFVCLSGAAEKATRGNRTTAVQTKRAHHSRGQHGSGRQDIQRRHTAGKGCFCGSISQTSRFSQLQSKFLNQYKLCVFFVTLIEILRAQ